MVSVRKRGVRRFVVLVSFIAVIVAVVFAVVGRGLLTGFGDPRPLLASVVLAGVISSLVAPVPILFCARLIADLEDARRLLKRSAVTDELTGVANRRGFLHDFEHRHWNCEGEGVTVGMVDVDQFKSLNDTHGHAVGDQALVEVAHWLRDRLGDDGLVGRLGGDEFAFVAPPSPAGRWPSRRCFDVGGVGFSVSIGTTQVTGPLTSTSLHSADTAMYRAKRRGGRGEIELRIAT